MQAECSRQCKAMQGSARLCTNIKGPPRIQARTPLPPKIQEETFFSPLEDNPACELEDRVGHFLKLGPETVGSDYIRDKFT